MEAAYHLAELIVGGGGHGAAIEHYQVGVGRLRWLRSGLGGQTCLKRGAIGLRCAAAECFYEELLHLF